MDNASPSLQEYLNRRFEALEKRLEVESALGHQRLEELTQHNRERFTNWVETLTERLEYEKRNGFQHQAETTRSLEAQVDRRLHALEAKMDAYTANHIREHGLIEAERLRAEGVLEARLQEMNHLRADLRGERAAFVSRDMLDQSLTTMRERIDAGMVLQNPQPAIEELRKRMEDADGRRANLEGRFWMLGSVLSALTVGASILVNMLTHH